MIKILNPVYIPTVLGVQIRAQKKDQNNTVSEDKYTGKQQPDTIDTLWLDKPVDIVKDKLLNDICIEPLATAYIKKWDC